MSNFIGPEKMSEQEKLKLERSINTELLSIDFKKMEKEIEDRASARALAKEELKNGTAFTAFLAAFHRPLWSIVCLVIYTWTMISPSFNFPDIEFTGLHKDVMMTVVIFYFGGRSIEKVFAVMKK
ncbi:MAG TPA: hypothetical protein ENH98_03600 [archaeon]|nr:hypothetical protein [archaeon]